MNDVSHERARDLINRHQGGISIKELHDYLADQSIISEPLASFGAKRGFYKDSRLTQLALEKLRDYGYSTKRVASMSSNEALIILRNNGAPAESMDYVDAVFSLGQLASALSESKSPQFATRILKTIIEIASSATNSVSKAGISDALIEQFRADPDKLVVDTIEGLERTLLGSGEICYRFENGADIEGIGRIRFLTSETLKHLQRLDNRLNGR